MLKFVKEKLYFLKRWYTVVFTYPQETLNVSEVLDYDAYWKQKRGDVQLGTARNLSGNERMRADYVISQIGTDKAVSIGDIASGPGVIYAYLKDRLMLTEYIGYDSSDYALEVGESLGMKGVKFDVNNPEELEAIKEADYFILLEILEHIPNSEKVLDTVFKKAQKGVFFSFPNSGNFLYRIRLLFGRMPMQWIKFPNEHLRFWTLTDLRWWLRALGYQNYKVHCYRGIPILEKWWPSMFAGSFVVSISKE
jgi:2-polyprenyl-3-methyl-5-hydroxy-6-metoxy-1,4-benzoquinol methylase